MELFTTDTDSTVEAGNGLFATPMPVDFTPCMAEPDLFFPAKQEQVDAARALCAECPVRALCFDGAVEREEPHGVWGGRLFLEGKVAEALPRRGRPPKTKAQVAPAA